MKKILVLVFVLSFNYIFSQNIEGVYYVNGDSSKEIEIIKIEGDLYQIITNEGWAGTGIFYNRNNKKTLMAIFKYDEPSKFDRGVHSAILQKNGNFKVSIRLWKDVWNKPKNEVSTVIWIKQ